MERRPVHHPQWQQFWPSAPVGSEKVEPEGRDDSSGNNGNRLADTHSLGCADPCEPPPQDG
ncbi:MAG: hypothetical protein AVDCRST_MAG64-1114 [uncultured Phycisphaerae bacterium]|uniref:Uncharacterized protein n=1 Tax=uncultured Phycisphaerae bacterium TaxID=904963 RepID=A0A6J4NNL6_9BACT|nr:MAG: hypothetical protein AVDCRST_MAG64-1114 [uncultured Phycisphaerae bacterium]